MSDWQVIRLREPQLGEHASAWDALNQSAFEDHPLLSSAFINTLLRHWGDGSEHLCTLDRGEGAIAMCVLRRGRRGQWASFLPTQAPLGPTLIREAAHVRTLLRRLPGHATSVDLLRVDPKFVQPDKPSAMAPDIAHHATRMTVALQGSFEAYWAGRATGLRQQLARCEQQVAEDGLTFWHVCRTQAAELTPAVARYAELASQSLKAQGNSALSPSDQQTPFCAQLLERWGATNSAHVHELWFGDTLAASCVVIGSARMQFAFKTACDQSLRQYVPDQLLQRRLIEASFASHSGQALEFCTRAKAEQLAWATAHGCIQDWTFYRSATTNAATNLGRAIWAAWAPAGRADGGGIKRSVEIYRHPDEFPADVQELFAMAECENVEFGAAWYRALVDGVFSGDDGVRFFVLSHDGCAVAAMPVLLGRNGMFRQVRALANFYTSLYSPIISSGLAATDLVPLISTIRDHGRRCASFQFAPMDPGSEAHGVLWLTLKVAGIVPLRYFCFGNWYLPSTGLNWQAYLASRESRLRNTLKRATKKFDTDGGRIEVVAQPERWQEACSAYEAVYSTSWKVPEPFLRFMPGLIETCARNGWLRMGITWLGERPIAVQLWIVAAGRAAIYKLAYDEGYKQYSPGTLLSAHLLRYVTEQDGVSEVDYLIGDDPYKKDWMSHRRERWGIVAYDPKTLGGWIGLAQELAGRIAKPWLLRLGKSRTGSR